MIQYNTNTNTNTIQYIYHHLVEFSDLYLGRNSTDFRLEHPKKTDFPAGNGEEIHGDDTPQSIRYNRYTI